MKRLLFILLALTLLIANLISCSETETIDYTNITDFEAALNNGDDLTGKSVTFEVKEFVPDSAFGYNMQAGEHLNFCSSEHPGVNTGDTISVKVTSITSIFGVYIIYYEKIS